MSGTASVVLSDGKLLVYGVSGGSQFFVRILPNGALDATFNPGGSTPGIKVIGDPQGLPGGFGFGQRLSMYVRADGRIVTALGSEAVRYTAQGDPDPTFAIPGGPLVAAGHVPLGGVGDPHVTPGPADKTLVVGLGGSPYGIQALRLLGDGSWDSSYDPSYFITSHVPGPVGLFGVSPIVANPVTGGSVTASYYYVNNVLVTATAVFNSDGYLDPPASSGIRSYSEIPGVAFPHIAVDAIGRVVVVGAGQDGVCRLFRVRADRTVDASFGSPANDHQIPLSGSCSAGVPVASNASSQIFVAVESASGVVVQQFNDTRLIGQVLLAGTEHAHPQQLLVDSQQRPILVATNGDDVVITRLDSELPPPQMVPLVPERLLDTRSDGPQLGYSGAKPAAGAMLEMQVTGVGASQIPSDAAAVVLNVTGTDATASGFVTVWPCGTNRPLASNLNLVAGGTSPNLVMVKVGAGGKVCLYTQTGTHLLADISAYIPVA